MKGLKLIIDEIESYDTSVNTILINEYCYYDLIKDNNYSFYTLWINDELYYRKFKRLIRLIPALITGIKPIY
jgi:hypothetical protein